MRQYLVMWMVVGLVQCLYGAEDSAREIVAAAENNLKYLTYTVNEIFPDKIKVWYHKFTADGLEKERIEFWRNHKKTALYIKNEDGTFKITPSSALKLDFEMGRLPLATKPEDVVYSFDTPRSGGNPNYCYIKKEFIITARNRMDLQQRFIDSIPNFGKRMNSAEREDFFETQFPAVTLYCIDKNNSLIIRRTQFNAAGELIHENRYQDWVLRQDIPEKYFQVPLNLTADIAKNIDSYVEKNATLMTPQTPKTSSTSGGWVRRLGRGIANWFWRNTAVFSLLSAIIFVAILGLLAVIKIGKNKQ